MVGCLLAHIGVVSHCIQAVMLRRIGFCIDLYWVALTHIDTSIFSMPKLIFIDFKIYHHALKQMKALILIDSH
jgi:hypothetical protein